MKTTIDLPDDLLIEAKKAAADQRTTVRALMERALRRELEYRVAQSSGLIRWVTVEGGLPVDFDVSNRRQMMDSMMAERRPGSGHKD